MELNDLNRVKHSDSLNKLLATRFNMTLDLEKLTEKRATKLLSAIEKTLTESQKGTGPYQTDKKYMASKLAKETVEAWLVENDLGINEKDEQSNEEPGDGAIEPQQELPGADAKRNQALRMLVGTQNFAKARRAMELYKQGKTVPPTLMIGLMPVIDMMDEIMSSGIANVRMLQMVQRRSKKALGINESTQINEGEMESAELVLASKDMVDRIQSMLEDVGEMMNEELLPLTDSIRDEMGNEKAEAFNNAAKGALEAFMDAVTTARGDMDNASRILIGEKPAVSDEPAVDLGADDSELDLDISGDTDADLDLDADPAGQEGDAELDREERI